MTVPFWERAFPLSARELAAQSSPLGRVGIGSAAFSGDAVEVLTMPSAEMIEDRFGPTESAQPVEFATVQAAMTNPIMLLGTPGYLGSKDEVEKELDLIAAAIRLFHMKPPDLVMRETSAYTARLTELAVLLHRAEAGSRQWTRVRTQQVQRFLDELDRQWRTASRLIEVNRQDLEVLRGQI